MILRKLENGGASTFSDAGRRGASVGFTCAPEKAEKLLPLLVTECTFEKWDIKEAQNTANVIVGEAMGNAQAVLIEQLYAAAYGPQSPLGKSIFTSSVGTPGIISFRESNYGMSGAVLSATGVSDHDAFVKSVSEGFAEASTGAVSEVASSSYMGGESRISAPSCGYTHLALGFEGPASSAALRNVMKYCLSLSSSNGVSGFTAPGLIGLYASAPASTSSTIMDSISEVLTSTLSDELVTRAKTLAKAEALFALDGGSKSLADSMTASILESGSFSREGISASYDNITKADVSAAMTSAVKSNPSVAAIGDISDIPYQAAISARFS